MIDVIVIGGGAAGLFCAALAGQRGLRVVLLEHNDKVGKKIRISGGGRCNFTNREVGPKNFLSQNPHFATSALSRYTPQDFIALVDRYGIAWHEKTLGQLFCDGSAQQIIDMLVTEGRGERVECLVSHAVQNVALTDADGEDHLFRVTTDHGDFVARNVVVAAGGLSIPSLGATGIGYDIARAFGMRIVKPEPALVPLTFDQAFTRTWGELAGVSLDVEAHADGPVFRENLLFTHRGLTGPAVLQASTYWTGGEVAINTLPDVLDQNTVPTLKSDKRILRNALVDLLPSRFLQRWPDVRLDKRAMDLKDADVADVLHQLHHWLITPNGTEGFLKAEVTRGGVDTRDLSSKTMESRTQPGLYFIGEVVDVTGWLGGYNFQWAWSSAFACASQLDG
ncbi:MAG: NAD(P)/FAD-dependent oxidoreductase [Ignavibacteriae bacterium]|nr:MAG: NAD(P)/FAD-dependent oxidoreductase [Ignavibacteriota bacterium]